MKVIIMSNEQKVTRKLRAIFSADVKGYSVLMADDEVSTHVLNSVVEESWMLWVTTYWLSLIVQWMPFSVP
jgi:hypothetical protein